MKRVFVFGEAELAQQIRQKIMQQEWLQNAANKMYQVGECILQTPENWLDEKKGTTARKIGGKIGALYTIWLLNGNNVYLEKAKAIFDQALARDLNYYYKELNHHLSVGDAVLSITVSFSLLYEHLDGEQREKAVVRLNELANWLYETDSTWGLPQESVTSCNHNCIHYGALGLCGLVLENEAWLRRGRERVEAFLQAATDKTGYFTEGLSYMNYGNMTAILFCEAYRQVFGEQLYHKPSSVQQVVAHMLPCKGTVLKLNDHGQSVENMLPQVYLASRYKDAGALYLINEYETAIGDFFSDWSMDMSGGFVYPFLYMFADGNLTPVKPSEYGTPKTQIFESGRVMTRTFWDDPLAFHVSVSCGHCFHYGHNHADKGSFTVYGMGEEFLIDIGSKTNEDRSHNILMINGIGQPNGRSRGEIRKLRDSEEALYVCCDTTRSYTYTPQTLIGMALRHVMFIKKPFPMLIVRDDVQLERPLEERQKFEFMIHTAKGNKVNLLEQAVEIIGQNLGNRCRLQFVAPSSVDVCISQENRLNNSYGKAVASADLSEEAIATCYGYNPYLTTIITFSGPDGQYPEVTVTGDPLHLSVQAVDNKKEKLVQIFRYGMTIVK